jgi:hypothetical protein
MLLDLYNNEAGSKEFTSAGTKAESEMQLIAPTSSPTIGNTLVVCRFLFAF